MSRTDNSTSAAGAVDSVGDAASDPSLLASSELVADSLGEYLRGQVKKVRSGESGVLPVVIGLVLIVVIFQTKNGKFLSSGNLVNLIDQGAFLMVLGMAEIFVLLLGEIDLALGFNMGIGATVAAEMAAPPHNVHWWLAILASMAACAIISCVEGLLITWLNLPSFIVTLGFFIGLQGVLLTLFNHDTHSSGGNINISNNVINDAVNGNLSPTAGWIAMAAVVGVFAALSLLRYRRRRQSSLVTAPLSLTLIKIVAVAIAGIVVVLVCNKERGGLTLSIKGVPWDIPIVLAVLAVLTFILNRTRFGRYVFAIGGNAEAARRAGISLRQVRVLAFVLSGATAGVAAVLYESLLGSVSSNVDGGTNVLYAVAAAVIGGTSLFGGRGKMIHAILGGLVIAAIANGMGLIALGAAPQFMVNGGVLIAAVTVDSIARRGRTAV